MTSIDRAFAALTPSETVRREVRARLHEQMQMPAPRAYHNEGHILAVLDRLFAWTDAPSPALLAAALYHDAVYDPTRRDNESRSADLCRAELQAIGIEEADINEAARLIELTASHQVQTSDRDGVLLLDADLFILGDTPEKYAAYVQAIRTEYAHVSEPDWRAGRASVMTRFLERERIYHGNWNRRDEREKQARANIAGEVAGLL